MVFNFFAKISAAILLIILCSPVKAQQFDTLLARLDAEYPQEKIYCQFDKAVYNPGETIWFKAYLFSGNDLSLISKTLYAEMMDDKGNVLERKTVPLLQSTAAASFTLSEKIASPVVYIKAYTRWMLNFDSAFLFIKALPVILVKKSANKIVHTAPQVSLHFFPEGGDLVESIESRVAFKATDKKGLPVSISGEIVDKALKKITDFTSVHDGMGDFLLTPNDEPYTARWKDAFGQKHETILPSAKKNGVVLEVNNRGDNVEFNIKCSPGLAPEFDSVTVVGHLQQQLLFIAKAKPSAGKTSHATISTEGVPSGIAQVTLFNNKGRPVAERIVFLHQQNASFITDINTALKDVGKRKKNVIQVDVPDTIACNLSIAVTDASINAGSKTGDNILSHLLLTSDIKGCVHNPGYYFSSDADSVIDHLDLVMLTNGWRRFKWETVLAGIRPEIKYAPDNYITIYGKIFGLSSIQLANKELTGMLKVKNGNMQVMTIPVTRDGNFAVPSMMYYDTAKLYYQFNGDKDKVLTASASYQVNTDFLKPSITDHIDSNWLAGLTFPDSLTAQKNKQANALAFSERDKFNSLQVLSAVVIKAKQRSKTDSMNAAYTSGLFTGGDANTFIVEDDPSAAGGRTVLEYLQGKVAGLSISVNGSQSSLSWRGGTPALYINEMQGQVDMIQNTPLTDVAMIKVFRPPFIGAMGGGSGGAIAVYLKKGGGRHSDVTALNFVNIPGYSLTKEFYTPDYSQADQDIDAGDYRTTLYWNPFVMTDKTHRRILIPFYNNDITKKIRVVIEGCNAEGKLTREEKVFE